MDATITGEILNDLIPYLEALETKSTAILEFLKKEGIASDETLAPYLERAAGASSVRWLAVRVRMERLLSSVEKQTGDKKTNEQESSGESDSTEPAQTTPKQAQSDEKLQPAGQETSGVNDEKAQLAVRNEPETQSAARNEEGKGGDGEGHVEPKSTVSTMERKVA